MLITLVASGRISQRKRNSFLLQPFEPGYVLIFEDAFAMDRQSATDLLIVKLPRQNKNVILLTHRIMFARRKLPNNHLSTSILYRAIQENNLCKAIL